MPIPYFYDQGNIQTHDVHLGPKVTMWYRAGNHEIWHVPTHRFWTGTGTPWGTSPSTYYIVRVERRGRGGEATILVAAAPGYAWNPVRRAMADLLDRNFEAQAKYGRSVASLHQKRQ